jgi:hypothetical protein
MKIGDYFVLKWRTDQYKILDIATCSNCRSFKIGYSTENKELDITENLKLHICTCLICGKNYEIKSNTNLSYSDIKMVCVIEEQFALSDILKKLNICKKEV